MADMGGQIDKMVSFIHFEAKNKKEEILAKAKQDEVVDDVKRLKEMKTKWSRLAEAPMPAKQKLELGRSLEIYEADEASIRCHDGGGAGRLLARSCWPLAALPTLCPAPDVHGAQPCSRRPAAGAPAP